MICPCIPVMVLVAASLLAALLGLAASADWLQRYSERRRALPPRLREPPPPWHAHRWAVAADAEGEAVGRCECGALAAVVVGGPR